MGIQMGRPTLPPRVQIAAAIAALVVAVILVRAVTQGFSFISLSDGYQQQVFGTADNFLRGEEGYLGGVVVLQNGDVIAAECETNRTRLHVFDADELDRGDDDDDDYPHDTPVHREEISDPLMGGCGIAYHPDGFIYSNMCESVVEFGSTIRCVGGFGVARIDLAGGDADDMRTVARMGPTGNALGIAVDPVTNRLVYPSAGCKPSFVSPQPLDCTIYSLDPVTGIAISFATFLASSVPYVDGIAFDPTGEFLFLTSRFPTSTTPGELIVVDRAGEIVQRIEITSPVLRTEPIGIGFHAESPKFVVTNNQNGTMTRFDFPDDDYTLPPTLSDFAIRGFRGDLMQAGPDGCLYLTQQRTRYNDRSTDDDDSIVQICPGFAPPPGVTPAPQPSSLAGFVYVDADDDGIRDTDERGISGVTINLSGTDDAGRSLSLTTTTAADGGYSFTDLFSGTYTISEVQPAQYLDGKDTQGTPGTGTTQNDRFANIVLAAGVDGTNNNFGELRPSSLGGYVFIDANANGVRNNGEAGIPGVTIRLTGTDNSGANVSLQMSTGSDGAYLFTGLRPGVYTISETQPAGFADGPDRQGTPGTGTTGNDVFTDITLNQGVDGRDNNFGELAFEFPAGGFFVVGDLAAQVGAQVNFWGAQWAPNNPTTGGKPPNSFKGFLTGNPPPCGGTWTSRPGNSSDPPASLPENSLMAIVVSSQVKQNGSVLTGNVARIVIVQVKPGYGPNPGRRGYGQVITVLCAG